MKEENKLPVSHLRNQLFDLTDSYDDGTPNIDPDKYYDDLPTPDPEFCFVRTETGNQQTAVINSMVLDSRRFVMVYFAGVLNWTDYKTGLMVVKTDAITYESDLVGVISCFKNRFAAEHGREDLDTKFWAAMDQKYPTING